MKKIFMFAGSSNCFHVWAELANQINSIADEDIEYYVLCDGGADYNKYMPFDIIKGINMQHIDLVPPKDLSGFYSESRGNSETEGESLKKKIKRILRTKLNFLYIGLQALVRIRSINGQKKHIREILKQHNPDIFLFVDGIRPGFELAAVSVAREMGILSVYCPFGCFPSPDEVISLGIRFPRVTDWQKKTFWFKYIKKHYPSNVGYSGDVVLLRYEIPDIVAMIATKTIPYSPWYPGGNDFAFVGIAERQAYEGAMSHFDEEHKSKIVLMRSIERSGVLKAYTDKERDIERIREEYGFGTGSLAIIAAEAIAEASFSVGYEETIKIYQGMVEALRKEYDYVLVSLHPRMPRERYEILEKTNGCKIANERLYKIISLGEGVVVFVPKFAPILLVEGIPVSVVDITIPEFESLLTEEGKEAFRNKVSERRNILNSEKDARDAELPDFYNYVVDLLKK